MVFTLAHLSDPHLGPVPKPRLRELIGKRATGFANWWYRRAAMHRPDILARVVADLKAQAPDHIAVTGDLVNIALPGEYPPARTWLEALGPPQDVTLVPGNHDAYVGAGAHGQQHWLDYMRGDAAPRAADSDFPFVRRRGALALIGVTSAVPSLPLMATGRVGAWQMQRLGPLLDACRNEGLFRVVLIHHPPTTSRRHFLRRLTDAPLLHDTIARHGAELMIHGHNHRSQTVWLDGPAGRVPAVGVPSASEMAPDGHDPAGYNLYRIQGTPDAWRCQMISRGIAGDGVSEIRRSVLT